jgi:hypothetical protein
MPSSLVNSQKAGAGDQEAGDEVDHRLPQAAAGLAFGNAQAAHGQHETQGAAEDEAQRGDQRRVGHHARADPDQGRPVATRRAGGRLTVAKAAAARFHQQPQAAQRQSHCHYPGHEVRADAGITGGGGDLRRTKGHHRRQQRAPQHR